MSIKQRIEADLKAAMLSADKARVTALRTLKSSILYAEVATGTREQGLSDKEIVELLRKEVKKRRESAELFLQGGNEEKAEAENREAEIINSYLPAELSDDALSVLV